MWHEKDNGRPRLLGDSDDNNVDATAPGARAAEGVVQIDENEGPSLPFGLAAAADDILDKDKKTKAKEKARRVEQIHDEVGPTDMISMGDTQSYSKNTRAKGAVEEIHDDDGPAHHTAATSAASRFAKKMKATDGQEVAELKPPVPLNFVDDFHGDNLKKPSHDAMIVPTSDDMDMDTEAQTILTRPEDVRRRNNARENNTNVDTEASAAARDPPTPEQTGVERESSVPIIPTAFLVEENDEEAMVISGYAEPMPPWWKQKRTRQLFALVAIVIILAVVGIGVALGTRPEPTESKPAPENIVLEPTSSPTSCSYRISKNAQLFDDLPVDGPGYIVIAADSSNLILATRPRDINSAESVYLIFYAWDGDQWELKNFVIEEAEENGLLFSADISGQTALVGFPKAGSNSGGAVYAYNQNSLGFWGKAASSLLPEDEGSVGKFGDSVSLDSGLACISADGDEEGSHVYLFKLVGDEWVQFDTVGPFSVVNDCFVAGETIAIKVYEGDLWLYSYDQETDKAVSLQEPVTVNSTKVKRIGATVLSERHLLYAIEKFNFIDGWRPEEVLAYQRQDSGSYNLVQQLNASDFDKEFGSALDLGGDFLVINGLNKTYTFAEQNDMWEEQEAVLDQPYKSYQVTGRSIVGVTERSEVVSFNVDGCIQPVPTQTPSISLAPSPLSSFAPSTVSSDVPSSSPSLSLAPTESCDWVDILLYHDPYPDEVSWKLERINENGNDIVAESEEYENYGQEEVTQQRYCLKEGMYKFVISDSGGDGICCLYGSGSYKLSSDGIILAQGGEFESSEAMQFSIPTPSNTTLATSIFESPMDVSIPAPSNSPSLGTSTFESSIPTPINSASLTTAADKTPIDICSGKNKKQCAKDDEACEYNDEEGKCYMKE